MYVATRINRYLVNLLHTGDTSNVFNDPNHPFSRFAAHDDAEGNKNRLHQALDECTEDAACNPALQLMFDIPSTPCHDAMQVVLTRYMRYANIRRNDSDSSDDE